MTLKINRITKTHRHLLREKKEICDLINGNPTEHGFCFPADILIDGYRKYFRDGIYNTDPKGDILARSAIKKYYEGEGKAIPADHIIVTPGTSESFFYLFSLLAKAHDNILVPVPSYPLFDHIAKLSHVSLKFYPLDEARGWRIDLQALERAIDARTRAIVIISPHNPTGSLLTPAEVETIFGLASKHGLAVIADEVFNEFIFTGPPLPRSLLPSSPPLLFTLNGISKMFALPALKLGWIAVSGKKSLVDGAVDHLETIADTFLSTHLPIQRSLPAIFEQGKVFQEAYIAEVGRRRAVLLSFLHNTRCLEIHPPEGGFYLMAKLNANSFTDEEELVIRLMQEAGVFVHPGFFYDHEEGTHIVLSFLSQETNLVMGLSKLVNFLPS